ncbi:MAG: cytochrome c1 [Gammaproteobacteria bacterium]|nr:cytochrome c1 [Gammaproteobacteria bacterium]MBT8063763.1 cytochrome c1 [Gammaproteobacteria bacterium]NNK32432.1 cytochrome c1 [Xanthomonadales bacterium]
MNTKPFAVLISLSALLSFAAPVFAAGGGALMHADVNVRDTAAIQRGARLFVNYCLSCHSASYMRYNRLAEDLGLDEEVVMDNLVFADVKIGETMDIAMQPEDAEAWLGKVPPDLSLHSRSRGADWLYTYLMTFYQDESGSWNNRVLPNASMPHVFWQLQGIQKPVYASQDGQDVVDHLVLAEPGLQTPEEYERTVRDLVTFMEYLGEPAKLVRKDVGIWVLLFLAAFALLAYALKAEYWRDVH